MENNTTVNIKYIVIALLLVFLTVTAYFTYTAISRSGKLEVQISTIPNDAKVTLSQTEVKEEEIYIFPGSYELIIEKNGFTTHKEIVKINDSNNTIDVALTPESDEAQAWANENNNLYTAFEGREGSRAIIKGQAVVQTSPIVSKLPFKNLIYSIGYQNDPEDPTGNSVIVTIHAPEGYRQGPINKIVSWGYEPTDLKIIFKDYENPFAL